MRPTIEPLPTVRTILFVVVWPNGSVVLLFMESEVIFEACPILFKQRQGKSFRDYNNNKN